LNAYADQPRDEDALKSPIVLVVEDEVLIRMAVADYLRECGFSVVEAASAAEAIRVLETAVPIDVVFTDVNMPGEMNGFGLARWVRAKRPAIQVVIASGVKHTAEQIGDLCEDGPLIVKPYDHGQVERRLRDLLVQSGRAKG
jgi:CheY-like chemotaxis protein